MHQCAAGGRLGGDGGARPPLLLKCPDFLKTQLLQVERAGINVLLVGDSAAMVVHGHDTTLPITLDDMLLHCRAVARGGWL